MAAFGVRGRFLSGVSQSETSMLHGIPKQPAGTNNLYGELSAVYVYLAFAAFCRAVPVRSFLRGWSSGQSRLSFPVKGSPVWTAKGKSIARKQELDVSAPCPRCSLLIDVCGAEDCSSACVFVSPAEPNLRPCAHPGEQWLERGQGRGSPSDVASNPDEIPSCSSWG